MISKYLIPYGAWVLLILTFVEDRSEACIFRSSGNMFASTKNNEILPERENPLVLDQDQYKGDRSIHTVCMDTTVSLVLVLVLDKDTVSIVEQTLIKTLIEMGKLKFHCPKDDGFYTDMLDCRKYYECINGNFTTHECENGTGFEPMAKSCVRGESVPLCQRVQRLEDHKCNGTGLETWTGHCEKFILCTGEAAFTSSCNRGDLFDQKLKLCLPEQDANCIIEINSSDGNADNKTLPK